MITAIKRVGIIGAGQMGSGIAHVCALAGYGVGLNDLSKERIDAGIAAVDFGLARQVKSHKITEDERVAALKNITPVEAFSEFSSYDLIIESVSENEAVKCDILQKICKYLGPETLLGTNTSSLSITRLAAATDRPEKFLGIHFMNPVPIMTLVELIRGFSTSDQAFVLIEDFVASLNKKVAISKDFPAFIVNRILLLMINEAIFTLYEGVGTIEAIDLAISLGAHHPMGPLQLADVIGLDTCLAIMRTLHQEFSDSKYRPCPLLVKYVEAGWLGRKTKRGFYDYHGEQPVPTRTR